MTGGRPSVLFDLGGYSVSRTGVGGIGLRAMELAEALADRFRIRVMARDGADAIAADGVEVLPITDWPALLRNADATFFFDVPDRTRMEEAVAARKLVVSENAPPIEHLDYPSLTASPHAAALHGEYRRGFVRQLEVSHHFLTRSDVEHAVLLGCLCAAGRLSPSDIGRSRELRHLASLIPIGYSAGSVRRAAERPARSVAQVLWTGGLWGHYDPITVINAAGLCRDRGTPVTVAFLYARPEPDTADSVAVMRRRIADLRLGDLVTLHDRPPSHDERDALLKGARALICLARPGAENRTCVRLRVRDSRLYGLPMVVDPYGPTATELTRDGRGVVLAGTGIEPVAQALAAAVEDGVTLASGGPDVSHCYDTTAAPFAAWLQEALA